MVGFLFDFFVRSTRQFVHAFSVLHRIQYRKVESLINFVQLQRVPLNGSVRCAEWMKKSWQVLEKSEWTNERFGCDKLLSSKLEVGGRWVRGTKMRHRNNSEIAQVGRSIANAHSVDDVETLVHHNSNLTAKMPLILAVLHCTLASSSWIFGTVKLRWIWPRNGKVDRQIAPIKRRHT